MSKKQVVQVLKVVGAVLLVSMMAARVVLRSKRQVDRGVTYGDIKR